ncbi:MAG: STAS domain-containing protein [Pontibacterium sp.]
MSEHSQIALPIALTIVEVESIRQNFLSELPTSFVLDASAVDHVDSAGLQLLASACLTVAQSGGKVEWTGVTASLAESVEQCGLKQVMGLPAMH